MDDLYHGTIYCLSCFKKNLLDMELCFPKEYKEYWELFTGDSVLYHITTEENYHCIRREGALKPCDPAPYQWAGLTAVFLTDSQDPSFEISYAAVLRHMQTTKHGKMVRLGIRTQNSLWRSDEEGIAEIISLSSIPVREIILAESVNF